MSLWFRMKNAFASGLIGMFALLAITGPATAAVFTWSGLGGNNLISNGGNWVGGTAPDFTFATPAQLVFGEAVGGTHSVEIDLAEDLIGNGTLDGLTFAADAPAYTFYPTNTGNKLVLTRSNTGSFNYLTNNSTATQVFDVEVGVRRTIVMAAAGDIKFNQTFYPGYNTTSSSYWALFAGQKDIYLNGNFVHGSATDTNNRAKVFFEGGGGKVYLGDLGTTYNGRMLVIGKEPTSVGPTTLCDAILVATHNNSFAGTGGNTYILSAATATQNDLNKSTGRIEFTNNITVAETFGLEGRVGPAANAFHLLNTSGNNTITGNIIDSASGELGTATPVDQTEYNIGSNGGSLTISGNITQSLANGARNLNLGGTSTEANTVSGIIGETTPGTTPSWNLVKKDSGTWNLSAANTYTGKTTVAGGTLALTGSGSIASSPLIEVQAGATFDVTGISGITLNTANSQKLAGGSATAGTVNGAVTVATGTTINPGTVGGAGTLAIVGNTTVDSGGLLSFDLGTTATIGGGINDLLNVTGNLAINSGSTISINKMGAAYTNGTYHLIDYSGGSYTPGLSGVALNVAGSSGRQTYTLNDATSGHINLIIGGAGPLNLTWVGNGTNNNWDNFTTADWTNGTAQHFESGDHVTFTDAGSNSPAIKLVGELAPASMTFTNTSAHNYTFGNTGTINAPTAPMALNGTGSVTFSNTSANTFGNITIASTGALTLSNTGTNTLGNVDVNAGTLNLANGANANTTGNITLTTGAVNITNGANNNLGAINTGTTGVLTFNQSADADWSGGALSGAGALKVQGSNVLTLSTNTNAFIGSVEVVAGATLKGNSASGVVTAFAGASGITIQPGASLNAQLVEWGTVNTPITVGGTGVGGQGAVYVSQGHSSSDATYGLLHNVTLSQDTTIAVTDPTGLLGFGFSSVHAPLSSTNLPGTLNGGGFTLTKVGLGECDIENVGDTHLKNINVLGGNLVMQYDATLGSNAGTVTVNDTDSASKDAAIGFYSTTEVHSKPIVIGANGGGVYGWRGAVEMTSPITTTTVGGDLRLKWLRTSGSMVVRGPITGPAGLIYSASSATPRTYLTNDGNTFAGPITVQSGTLVIGDGGTTGSLGTATNVDMQGGTLVWNLNKTYTVTKTYFGEGGVSFGENNVTRGLPSAVVTVNLDSTYSGPTGIYQGKVILKTSNGFGADFGGSFGTVSVLSNATSTTGGQLDLDGSGGDLTIPQSFLTAGSGGYGGFFYGGPGAIRNVAGNNKIGGNLNLADGGNTLIVSAGGSLELAGMISNSSTQRALVLGGTAPGLISGTIQDGNTGTTGRTRIEKVGTGTWTISGNASNNGLTDIYEGTLALKDYSGMASAAITLAKPGATFDVTGLAALYYPAGTFALGSAGILQILQGAGTVNGNLVFENAGGVISTGGPATVYYTNGKSSPYNAPSGPMTIQGNLDLGYGGNTLQFSLANSPASAGNGKITVTGALTKGAYYDTNVAIVPTTSLTAGRYNLLSASSVVANAGGFALDPMLGEGQNTRYTFTLDNTTDPKKLDLIVAGSNASMNWTGATSADWDVKVTPNWTGAVDGTFYQADAVTFGDGATTTAVNLVAAVRPASITVNSSADYSLGGTNGWITGGTGITKSGSGTLTISNYNNNGTTTDATDDIYNDFNGTVTINGGTLKVGNAYALGNSSNGGEFPNAGTLVNGGTLDLNGQNVSAETISVQNGGSIINNGTANTLLAYVELTGNATFGGSRFWQIVSGSASPGFTLPYLKGNNNTLTKIGTNEVDLADLGETNLGNINVQGGALYFVGNTTMGNTANAVLLSNNAILGLQDCTVTHAKTVVVDATGGSIDNYRGNNAMTSLIALNGACTLSTGNGSTLTLSGVISGSGGLTKDNYNAAGGTVILSGNNSYQGPTLISAGTLELTATGQISTASAITNNALFQIDGGTHALGTISGTGTMSVLGSSTITAVSISQETLTIGGSAAAVAAVPEPGTLWLLLIGLVALATWRRMNGNR